LSALIVVCALVISATALAQDSLPGLDGVPPMPGFTVSGPPQRGVSANGPSVQLIAEGSGASGADIIAHYQAALPPRGWVLRGDLAAILLGGAEGGAVFERGSERLTLALRERGGRMLILYALAPIPPTQNQLNAP
jgi:hypothetical protein